MAVAIAWALAVGAVSAQGWAPPAAPGTGGGVIAPELVNFVLPDQSRAVAFSGTKLTPVYSRDTGFKIELEIEPAGTAGYRKLTGRLEAQAAVNRSRRAVVRFSTGTWYRTEDFVAETVVEVPAGQTAVDFEMLLSRYTEWYSCGLEIRIDGQFDEELSVDRMGLSRGGAPGMAVLALAGKGIDQPLRDSLQGMGFFRGDVEQRFISGRGEWPSDWLEYTSFDLVLLNADALADLAENEPERADALLRWVRAGGNLWITEVGERFTQLEEVDGVLHGKSVDSQSSSPQALSAQGPDDADRNDDPLGQGWVVPRPRRESDAPVDTLLAVRGVDLDGGPAPGNQEDERGEWRERRYLIRSYGLGLTTVFAGDVPSMADRWLRRQPSQVLQGMVTEFMRSPLIARLDWGSRHGFDPGQYCDEFNNWLIPGVGLAPVTPFQVLITLFVVLVGPVNYWLLARRQKLPMLLATAPAAALSAVALLFAYGLVTDGIGVRVRARSYTELDQRTGAAVASTRASYYAGMAPPQGLSLPADVEAYPLLPRWETQRRDRGGASRREVVWDGTQRLAHGWVPSRTPAQVVMTAARQSQARLDVRAGARGIQVTNRLGVDVVFAGIEDGQGRFFQVENLAADASVNLEPVEWSELAPRMRSLFSENEPRYPAGAESRRQRDPMARQWSYGLLETHLAAVTAPQVRGFGHESYVAVTKTGVEVDLGLPLVELDTEGSFHVLRGRW